MLAEVQAGLLGLVQQRFCELLAPVPPSPRLLLPLNGRVGWEGAVGLGLHGPCADGAHGPRKSPRALILCL